MKIEQFKDIKKFDYFDGDPRLTVLEHISPMILSGGLNLEFGVYSGKTINCLANQRTDLTFDGFDSFVGLPEDWDLGGKFCPKEKFDVKGNIPEVADNVDLHIGWFDDTLPKFLEENKQNAALIHVDSDIYSSAKTIFDLMNDRIIPGTIIVFDELCDWRHEFNEVAPVSYAYYTTWKKHEWKALNEWLETYNRKVSPICRSWFQQAAVMVEE
jgi:hypothetical protein